MDILVYEHILGKEHNKNSPALLINEAKLIVRYLLKDLTEFYPKSKISLLTNKKNNFFNGINIIPRDYDLVLVDDMNIHKQNYSKMMVLAPEENMKMHNNL